VGQSWETPLIEVPEGRIDAAAIDTMISNYRNTYQNLNGNRFDQIDVEAVTYRVQVILPSTKVNYPELQSVGNAAPIGEMTLAYLYDEPRTAAEYDRDSLGRGQVIDGPAIIREEMSTTFVPSGRTATVGSRGEIIIE
jgi:N-methylhydantoinase A